MAFDTALVLRVGSASLFILLGLAVGVVGRRSPRVMILGMVLGVYGLQILINNVARSLHFGFYLERGILNLVSAALVTLALFLLPRSVSSRPAKAAWYGLALSLVTRVAVLDGTNLDGFDRLLGFDGAPANLLPFLHLVGPFVGFAAGVIALAASAAVAFDPPATASGWRNAAALALSLGIWAVIQTATLTQQPFTVPSFSGEVVLVVGLAVPWLVAAVRTGNRLAARMALVWPGLGLVAYVYLLAPGSGVAAFFDPWGLLGIARLVGWGILVHAIVKDDLLGVPLPHVVVRRGAVAGTALATLFIVAQIAQNFFSAEYGLLTGGIVAGTFLFAASPLQRAMERVGEGKPGRGAPPSATGGNDDAYRAAMRLAFRDRRLSADEELSLADVAERLGIGARRATEIRHQVEHEKGVA